MKETAFTIASIHLSTFETQNSTHPSPRRKTPRPITMKTDAATVIVAVFSAGLASAWRTRPLPNQGEKGCETHADCGGCDGNADLDAMFQDGAANGFGTKTCYTCKKVWHTEGNYDGPSKKCLAQQYSDWELEWVGFSILSLH